MNITGAIQYPFAKQNVLRILVIPFLLTMAGVILMLAIPAAMMVPYLSSLLTMDPAALEHAGTSPAGLLSLIPASAMGMGIAGMLIGILAAMVCMVPLNGYMWELIDN